MHQHSFASKSSFFNELNTFIEMLAHVILWRIVGENVFGNYFLVVRVDWNSPCNIQNLFFGGELINKN